MDATYVEAGSDSSNHVAATWPVIEMNGSASCGKAETTKAANSVLESEPALAHSWFSCVWASWLTWLRMYWRSCADTAISHSGL